MEDSNSFGLSALGIAGDFTVEVLSLPEGGGLLSIESPTWCFDFELSGPSAVGELAEFLQTYAGRAEFAEMAIGTFGGAVVRVVKDSEFEDRFFIRATCTGPMVEFTLVGNAAKDFVSAVVEVTAEFGAEA